MDDAIATYCLSIPELALVIGERIQVNPLSGGMCNDVFCVRGTKGAVLLKKGEPYFRAAPSVSIDMARQATEAEAMRLGNSLAPGSVPRPLHYNPSTGVLATEFLEGRRMLGTALRNGSTHPGMAAQLGRCLARVAAGTSPEAMGPEAFSALRALLEHSASLGTLIEDYTLYRPFDPATPDNRWAPELSADVARLLHGDARVRQEVAALQSAYRRPPLGQLSLIHGDANITNILCCPSDGRGCGDDGAGGDGEARPAALIDWEFASVGHTAFDVAHVLANLLLGLLLLRAYDDQEVRAATSAAALQAEDVGDGGKHEQHHQQQRRQQRKQQRTWLLASIPELWQAYCTERVAQAQAAAAAARGRAEAAAAAAAEAATAADRLLPDVLGFASAIAIRFSIGAFNFFDQASEVPLPQRSAEHTCAVRGTLRIGSALLLRRRELSMQQVVALVEEELDAGAVAAETVATPAARAGSSAAAQASAIPETTAANAAAALSHVLRRRGASCCHIRVGGAAAAPWAKDNARLAQRHSTSSLTVGGM